MIKTHKHEILQYLRIIKNYVDVSNKHVGARDIRDDLIPACHAHHAQSLSA